MYEQQITSEKNVSVPLKGIVLNGEKNEPSKTTCETKPFRPFRNLVTWRLFCGSYKTPETHPDKFLPKSSNFYSRSFWKILENTKQWTVDRWCDWRSLFLIGCGRFCRWSFKMLFRGLMRLCFDFYITYRLRGNFPLKIIYLFGCFSLSLLLGRPFKSHNMYLVPIVTYQLQSRPLGCKCRKSFP